MCPILWEKWDYFKIVLKKQLLVTTKTNVVKKNKQLFKFPAFQP